MTDLVTYQVDGKTAAALDASTAPKTAVAYWWDGKIRYTNRKHLQHLVNLDIYKIDVEETIKVLKSQPANINAEEEYEKPENLLGICLKLAQLSDVEFKGLQEGDLIVYKNGKLKNKKPCHHSFNRSSQSWSTWTSNNDDNANNNDDSIYDDAPNNYKKGWRLIPGLEVKAGSTEVADYKIAFNINCYITNAKRYVKLGVFINGIEQEHITDDYYFKDSYESNPLMVNDKLYDVPPNAIINVRVKRGSSGSGTTFVTKRRTLFADEIMM